MALVEAHYCCLSSQSNVYSYCKFTGPCGRQNLLVAALRGRVISLEFQKSRPLSRDVHFTYIPGDAEVVSLDAFNKHHHSGGIVVGITFIKHVDEGKSNQYLNIYSEWESGAEYDLDRIAQGCQNLELDFIPYQLYHTDINLTDSTEIVFLLSGNDQKVHLYRENKTSHTFAEEDGSDLFPEFDDLQSCVVCIEIRNLNDHQYRLTALGFLDGRVNISVVDCDTLKIIEKWSVQHDSPITSLHLFNHHSSVDCPSFVNMVIDPMGESFEAGEQQGLHLLVTSALEVATVYRNILDRGPKDPLLLHGSDQYDTILCSLITDIDFDGQNEIILGSYGQQMLVYKFHSRAKISNPSNDACEKPPLPSSVVLETQEKQESSGLNCGALDQHETDDTGLQIKDSHFCSTSSTTVESDENDAASAGIAASDFNLSDGHYSLLWQRQFADPVLSLDAVDVLGDGVLELVVVSLKGLHVLQHNPVDVAHLCLERMQQVAQAQNKQDDVFKQLLAENLTANG